MTWHNLLGIALAPLMTAFLVYIGVKIKVLILTKMKDGWLKDQLLRERWNSNASQSHRRLTRGQKSFR
jgi:hypothetical protein